MKIRFIYANTPFWRAEIGRIALHLGGVTFEDLRIDREEYSRVRDIGKLDDGTKIPFRQIPCLNIDGQSINQTGGISRFCGKLSGLYPKNDLVQAALIDQVIDMASDITNLLGASMREEDENKKKEIRIQLSKGDLSRKISFLEQILTENSWHWMAGHEMTIADIAIWRLMGWLTSGAVDHIPRTLLKPFPNIKNVCKQVGSHPKIVEWVNMTYPENYSMGNPD